MHRAPGEVVLLRDVHDGHVSAAMPVVVVEETVERVVLWLRAGSPIMWIGATSLPAWIDAGRPLVRKEWDDNDRLFIWPVGRSSLVSFFWEAATGNEMSWYVDLIDPWRRTPMGWDSTDRELDIVAWPDLSAWWWKDVDKFEEQIERGLVSREDEARIRAEAAVVIGEIEARAGVFADAERWRSWRPDPSWTIPSLPEGWDSV